MDPSAPIDALELATRLARDHGELARAHDPQEFLRAVSDALATFAPAYLDLAYVHLDADDRPGLFEVVECWQDGRRITDSPLLGGRFPVAMFPLAQLMLRTASDPQILPDIAAEPDIAEVMSNVGRRLASAVLLPLFSQRQRTWQGVLGLYWTERHDPTPPQRAHYALLMHIFAEALASMRTHAALRDSLRRNEALLERTAATLRATEAERVTLQALLDHLPVGVAVTHGHTGARELVNSRGAALLGEPDGVTPDVQAVFRPGESVPLPVEQLPHFITMTTGATHTAELEFQRPDGTRTLFDVTTSLLRYTGDPVPRVIIIYQDITAVRRHELERLRAQDELLKAQELALAERSTPLIPVLDDVLVMPIIGTIDRARGQQILETLVHLGGATRVRAAIVDVTGVRELDTTAAAVLVHAARALRLRGIQPVLTGIQPAVAQALVALGIDLTGITTHATVQAAVAHATARS